jgi:hypothetical protein
MNAITQKSRSFLFTQEREKGMKTNTLVKDKDLRRIMAIELLSFRGLRKNLAIDLKDPFYFGAIVGFKTALRRIQMERDLGQA